MNQYTSDIAFTPAVKAVQQRLGSRRGYANMEQGSGWNSTVDESLANFIAQRDSFYIATASAEGQPYIQHRGGPPGFLKVLNESTLAFADYTGNRQYISVGNLSENDRASMFLMDYPNCRRIKIWGLAEVVDNNPDLLAQLLDDNYEATPERAILFHVEAWDANCPQHIQPRFTEAEIAPTINALQQQITDLRQKLAQYESN